VRIDGVRQVVDPDVSWIADRWVPRDAGRDEDGLMIGILSAPFDYAVSYRPGARFGPAAIVDELNQLSLYCVDKRVDLENVRFADLGSIPVDHSLEVSYRRIEEAASQIPSHVQPIVLGGDHSITDPVIRGLCRRNGDRSVGIVVFDAHFDSREPVPGREHSGHWVRTLADVVDYRAMAQLGISAAIYSSAYMAEAEANGIIVRTPYDLRRAGMTAVLDEVIRSVSQYASEVYISVDIDCVDKAFAPGTSSANPAGLTPHELIDGVFHLSRELEIVCMDLVEISPPLDTANYTSALGAQVILNHIAGCVMRDRRTRGGL
jgi:agmatinase